MRSDSTTGMGSWELRSKTPRDGGRNFAEIDRMEMVQRHVGRQTVWSTNVLTAEGSAGSETDVQVVFYIPVPCPAHTSRMPPRDNTGSRSVSLFPDCVLANKSHRSAVSCRCLRPHSVPLDLSIGLSLPLSINKSISQTNKQSVNRSPSIRQHTLSLSIDPCQLESIPLPCQSISVN